MAEWLAAMSINLKDGLTCQAIVITLGNVHAA